MSNAPACTYQVYPGDYFSPPEYCPNDAVEGEEYCPDHLPPEPDPDELRDWIFEREYEGGYE